MVTIVFSLGINDHDILLIKNKTGYNSAHSNKGANHWSTMKQWFIPPVIDTGLMRALSCEL